MVVDLERLFSSVSVTESELLKVDVSEKDPESEREYSSVSEYVSDSDDELERDLDVSSDREKDKEEVAVVVGESVALNVSEVDLEWLSS